MLFSVSGPAVFFVFVLVEFSSSRVVVFHECSCLVMSCLLLTVPGCRMAPVAPLGSTRPVFTFPASSWLALGCSWIFLRGTHDLLGNQFRWAILLIFSIGHIVCQLNSLNNLASLMSTNLQPYRSPEGRLPIDVALLSCTSYIICVVSLHILSMVRTKVTKLC